MSLLPEPELPTIVSILLVHVATERQLSPSQFDASSPLDAHVQHVVGHAFLPLMHVVNLVKKGPYNSVITEDRAIWGS